MFILTMVNKYGSKFSLSTLKGSISLTLKGQYGNGRNAGAIDELRFGPLGSWYHILFRLRVRCLDDGFDERHDNDRTHMLTYMSHRIH